MPDQKPMWTRCLGWFSVMWVTKLLIRRDKSFPCSPISCINFKRERSVVFLRRGLCCGSNAPPEENLPVVSEPLSSYIVLFQVAFFVIYWRSFFQSIFCLVGAAVATSRLGAPPKGSHSNPKVKLILIQGVRPWVLLGRYHVVPFAEQGIVTAKIKNESSN